MNSIRIFIPLYNLAKIFSPELILNYAKVVPVENAQIPVNIKDGFIYSRYPFKYVLEIEKLDEVSRRTLDRALVIFKLFKNEIILSNYLYIAPGDYDFLPHYVYWQEPNEKLDPFTLKSEEEENNFKEFWNKFIKMPMNFAIERFHLADFEVYGDWRYLNYVYALEYLFIPEFTEIDFREKFLTRIALFFDREFYIKKAEPSISFFDREFYKKERVKDIIDFAINLSHSIRRGNWIRRDELIGNQKWTDMRKPIRILIQEAIKFFYKHECIENTEDNLLDNNEERRKYLVGLEG